MVDWFLMSRMLKKTLEPFYCRLGNSFRNFWDGPLDISFIGEGRLLPDVDVFENDEEFHVKANIRGLEKNDLYINLNKRKLSLRGRKRMKKEEMRSQYHIIERSGIYFNHTVQLPHEIDEKNLKATIKDGVVDVILPKINHIH